jgi:lantibiotic modifying enzyme
MRRGRAWVVNRVAAVPLTGFSHGASGIAWALSELFSVTGEDRYLQMVSEALEYERSLFVLEQGNWPDLRHDPSANGDSGSRLMMLKHLNEKILREEAEIALRTTLREGFGANHCLCHGDLGNLEVILQATLILNDSVWKTEADRLIAVVLKSIERDGWLCGTPGNVETPGLLTGIAGIGMQLLRLADPSQVPSVLCLQPPISYGKFVAETATAAISGAVARRGATHAF